MKVMFLDESGDHNLSVIDPQYPLFVLAGVMADKDYAETAMTEKVRRFKLDVLGAEDVILHTADITRNRNGFERMKETDFRSRFYGRLNDLMRELDYKVAACVIRKQAHLSAYGLAALDPYMLSLDILVERFCFEMGDTAGMIIAEKRNPTLDHELDLAWLNLKVQGTRHVPAHDIERRIRGLVTRPKQDRIAGLEIADLVATPIGRYAMRKQIKEDFRIIEGKFQTNRQGSYEGAGLVILPKE
ncbi:MAG: DUF3800 domain-containing protein [Verrucomicrobia bacterium]|nr:DUF3800 domain-containing protein [Verrucomicrobiota bacterium]